MLSPTVREPGAFVASTVKEYDQLFLEGQSVSLLFKPCTRPDTRAIVRGSLCGVVIVAPDVTFKFLDDEIHSVQANGSPAKAMHIKAIDFDIAEVHTGSSRPGSSSWMVSRQYQLAGSRLSFTILEQSSPGDHMEIQLPMVVVNSELVQLPTIEVKANMGQSCRQGAR